MSRSIARGAAWVIFGLFLLAAWAGPVRAVLGVSMIWATLIAIAPSLAVIAALAWRHTLIAPSRRSLLVLCVFALVAMVLMWSRRFGPLIGWIGSDGGVHVSYRDRFVGAEPSIYDGFVSFYGFTWWIERVFRTDAFWSFGAAFSIVSALTSAGAAFAILRAATLPDGDTAPASRGAVAAALVVAALALLGVALPLVSYYQADGFFPQLWGLVPILAFWLADVAGLGMARRGFLLAISVVMVRYTYGLMLGDLLVVLPVLVLIEAIAAIHRRDPRRVWWVLLALVACAGCVLVLHRFMLTMFQVLPRYGWFIKHDYERVARWTAFTSAALAACAICAPALGRFIAVPVIIGVANCALSRYMRAHISGEHYYLYKYNFHALVLLALAVPAAVVFAARRNARDGLRRWILRLAALFALVGLIQIARALEPMRGLFTQRAFNRTATGEEILEKLRVGPLVDMGAAQRIRERLASAHAAFGGFLISSGPVFNFMNADLGHYGRGFFNPERVDLSPGHCVFWSTKNGRGALLWPMTAWMTGEIERLKRDPGTECRSYRATWDATVERDLCGVCVAAPPKNPDQR